MLCLALKPVSVIRWDTAGRHLTILTSHQDNWLSHWTYLNDPMICLSSYNDKKNRRLKNFHLHFWWCTEQMTRRYQFSWLLGVHYSLDQVNLPDSRWRSVLSPSECFLQLLHFLNGHYLDKRSHYQSHRVLSKSCFLSVLIMIFFLISKWFNKNYHSRFAPVLWWTVWKKRKLIH